MCGYCMEVIAFFTVLTGEEAPEDMGGCFSEEAVKLFRSGSPADREAMQDAWQKLEPVHARLALWQSGALRRMTTRDYGDGQGMTHWLRGSW